jgi:succinate dehydrogenase / fumarate reductase cytochrome b subunit
MPDIRATAPHSRPLTVPTGPLGFLSMTVGLKHIMAVTGAVLVGFVFVHFVGNALIWFGPEAINAYSHALHAAPELLWIARSVLIVAVIAHIAAALKLAAKNTAARQQRYKKKRDHVTNYAARTMIVSGPILLGFILFHLAHLTLGVAPGTYAHSETDVYSNVVHGFSIPWVTGLYVVSMLALGAHLFHGTWSMFQSLGLNHATYNHKLMRLALGITVFVTLGDIAIPLSVLLGLVS